ncbi:MAG: dioxygenase extradiol [Sphingomonadales bacterium]|jgi:4,5-DOPA dioxygenase extradiol|nr:dioxygenase extradiol [Sphingomonadales bacterium]
MITQPALFLSHGAPDLALSDAPARAFLESLGPRLDRPDAIVIVSAHHEAGGGPHVRAPARFRTWHDFGNFDRRLFDMRYEPAGDPALADEVMRLLAKAGMSPVRDGSDLLDHGAWVPLSLLFPDADVPVVAVSIDPAQDSRWHERIGRALAPLRSGNVLLIGSGSISHNLRAVFTAAAGEDRAWVESFTSWLEEAIRTGDRERLLSAMAEAPGAARNHPTDEHLLPLFFAAGAGGPAGARLHHSYTYDVLAMDVYAFGEPAVLAGFAADVDKPPAM